MDFLLKNSGFMHIIDFSDVLIPKTKLIIDYLLLLDNSLKLCNYHLLI